MAARESSSELSSLAAKVLKSDGMSDIDIGGGFVLTIGDAAKRLAGSVLSQDETPGQMPEEAVERAHDAAANLPEPSAPDPSVMRAELINIVLGKGGISEGKAERIVDELLLKQMQYYASMADPALEAESTEQYAVVMEAKGIIEALVRQGAAVAEYMADKALWQRTAIRARQLAQAMENMFA